MAIPITDGQGQSSVATEQIGTVKYQQIKIIGGETGSTSVMGVNPDRTISVSVVGAVQITGSVVALANGNQSISGTVGASVIGTVPVTATSVGGASPATVFNIGAQASGAVINTVSMGNNLGDGGGATALAVANMVYNGSNWDRQRGNSSVGAVVTTASSSVLTIWQSPSIVGTYAEDAGSASGDKGIFTLGVRNDTVASLASADLDYLARASDSAGRALTKPFAAEESRIEGYNSVVSTSVTTLVAAAGAGLKNYITDIILVNTGAATTLVTFRSGGGTSVLGYGIAPAGGGSNMIGFAMPLKTLANESFDFQPTTASSVLFATVKGYKAP